MALGVETAAIWSPEKLKLAPLPLMNERLPMIELRLLGRSELLYPPMGGNTGSDDDLLQEEIIAAEINIPAANK